jgi:hypothetical protein
VNERGLDDLSWLYDLTPQEIEAMTPGERISLMWPMAVADYLNAALTYATSPFDATLYDL